MMTQSPYPPHYPGLPPHRGVLILILGVLSLCVCGILGPFAWIMGKGDLEQMDAGQMDPEGRGMTQGGMICGIISSVLLILGFVFAVLFAIFAITGAIASP